MSKYVTNIWFSPPGNSSKGRSGLDLLGHPDLELVSSEIAAVENGNLLIRSTQVYGGSSQNFNLPITGVLMWTSYEIKS